MENLEAQVLDVSKVKIIPSDTEIPVHGNSIQTKRPLCSNFPENSVILDQTEAIVKIVTDISEDLEENQQNCLNNVPQYIEELQAIFDPLNVEECISDLFEEGTYTTIDSLEELKKFLSELLIRFDTNPKNYTREDYSYLLGILYKSLIHLYEYNPDNVIVTQWSNPLSDKKVPSEKLVKKTIDSVEQTLDNKITQVGTDLQSEVENRQSEITRIEGLISDEALQRESADQNLQNTKQDNLTAGENISIENNVISAVDTIYDDTEVRGLIDQVDQKVDALDEFECGEIVPTTTNFVEGTEYTVHEALQRTANLFEGYQGYIDDINELIPNQTTPQNQLADKAFVNSTVATNAANFKGNWTNFTAVPTNASDYPADYTGSKTPSNNDYLVVQDGTDYDPLDTGMWRFIYIGTWGVDGKLGWHPQYRVGSAFTAEQQAAIDSGITQSKVTKYDNYNNTIGALQTDKVDKVYTANKVYGTNNLGVQTAYTAGTGIAFENGQIKNTTLPLILAAL